MAKELESVTKIKVGKVIQEAVRQAKAWRKRPTRENRSEYDRLFAEIYACFYPDVYQVVNRTIRPVGTQQDIEEICNDIFTEMWEKLHKFE